MKTKVKLEPLARSQGLPVLRAAKYVALRRAAEILECRPEDLLHLGTLGEIRLLAPVLIPGAYTWPNDTAGIPFPMISTPERRPFDTTSRVFLLAEDIARIEAVGWTIPIAFVAPEIATSVVEDAQLWSDQPPEPLNEHMQRLADMSLYTPWRILERPSKDDPRTTAEHLFVTAGDLSRLLGESLSSASTTGPSTDAAYPSETEVHGNTLANINKRLKIMEAAIYCKHKWPKDCEKPVQWAGKIDEMSAFFWGSKTVDRDARPPYSRDWIIRELNRILKIEDVPMAVQTVKPAVGTAERGDDERQIPGARSSRTQPPPKAAKSARPAKSPKRRLRK